MDIENQDKSNSPDFIDRHKVKIPTILTIRDVIFLVVAAGSLVFSWAQYGERVSIIEQRITAYQNENEAFHYDQKGISQLLNDIRTRLKILETGVDRLKEDIGEVENEEKNLHKEHQIMAKEVSEMQLDLARCQARMENLSGK